jgi:hypothetical protein
MEHDCQLAEGVVRFECDFTNPDDRSQRVTIKIELTPDETRIIRMLHREHAPNVELTTHAYALKHAYAQAPEGFRHVRNGVRQVLVN